MSYPLLPYGRHSRTREGMAQNFPSPGISCLWFRHMRTRIIKAREEVSSELLCIWTAELEVTSECLCQVETLAGLGILTSFRSNSEASRKEISGLDALLHGIVERDMGRCA
jgi:hypothetical protein